MTTSRALVVAIVVQLLAAISPAWSTITKHSHFICPNCATEFDHDTVWSSLSDGHYLDGRPFGDGLWPWPMPVCPKCHFVVYKGWFTADEVDKLRAFVASPAYATLLAEKHSPHYLAAVIRERMGDSPGDLAYAYLHASWSVAGSRDHWSLYTAAALKHMDAFLASRPRGDRRHLAEVTVELIRGDLLRELGRFDEAEAYFLAVAARAEMAPYADRIALEFSLIADRNSDPEPSARTPKALRRAQALAAARERPGWQAVLDRFDVVDADMWPMSDESSLDGLAIVILRARTATPPTVQMEVHFDALGMAGVWGNSFTPPPDPNFNWNREIASFDEANRAIRAAAWIRQWQEAGGDRHLAIGLDDRGEQASHYVSADLLAHAGLPARGVYEVGMMVEGQQAARFLIAPDGTAVVEETSPVPGAHWLDREDFLLSVWNDNPPHYIKVDPRGRATWNLRRW